MRVEQLMTRQVKACSPEDTLAQAAQIMWDADCGCLPVCAENGANRVVGIITDRDICMSAMFKGKPLHELSVVDTMSRQLKVCGPRDSIAEVEQTMREARIRRLPVVDDQGLLRGMIALADLAREAAREVEDTTRAITETEVGDTLAAICEPTGQHLAM